jgi:hypothetical protein
MNYGRSSVLATGLWCHRFSFGMISFYMHLNLYMARVKNGLGNRKDLDPNLILFLLSVCCLMNIFLEINSK